MIEVSSNEPTALEQTSRQAITNARYLQWRETSSFSLVQHPHHIFLEHQDDFEHSEKIKDMEEIAKPICPGISIFLCVCLDLLDSQHPTF